MKLLVTVVAALVLSGCSSGGGPTDAGTGGGSAGGGAGGGGGGGGGTAGGSGGGTVDAGDPACASDGGLPGLSKCGCGGFTFCENFEGAAIDLTTWTLDTSNGTAALDTTKSARGSKSLHVNVKSNAGSRALLNTTKPFPAMNNGFFGRAFVFASPPTPTVHAGMFAASGPGVEVRLGLDHNSDIEPNYFGATEKGIFTSGKSKMPTSVWSCLEWEYRGAGGTTGEFHYFLNGTEMTQIKVLASEMWTVPTYTTFSLGMILFQSDTATATSFDIWFDEVALSTTRIGCTN